MDYQKESYELIELNVTEFEKEDIITASDLYYTLKEYEMMI